MAGAMTKCDYPQIQEIRFYIYQGKTVVEDLRSGKLDRARPNGERNRGVIKETEGRSAADRGPFPGPQTANRRIYFLAVNIKKLDDANLRQALSFAIDREGLLSKHFRGPLKVPVHKAAERPIPAGSWACRPEGGNPDSKTSRQLYDPDAAKLLSQQQEVLDAVKNGSWTLKYPNDNPALDEAMKELCADVQTLTGVKLEPTPLSPYQLREDVEVTKKYDLAYYHYDFPDESYWLAPLFGPPPGAAEDVTVHIQIQ